MFSTGALTISILGFNRLALFVLLAQNSPCTNKDCTPISELYTGREQTGAKHLILQKYIEGLAFKVLRHYELTFVDGFCGPWQTRAEGVSRDGISSTA